MTEGSSERNDVSSGAASRVRHWVVVACFLMSALLYLDRFCVSFAEPYIKQSLGLSTFQMSFFFSAFFLTYALAQVPSGWLSDRYGARLMLTLYILAWSFFTAMIGLAYGFAMLLIMRAGCGLGQAGAYPTSANVLSKWVPFRSRGMASGLVALGGRFGGALAPALTAFLIVLFVPFQSSSLFEETDLLDGPALCTALNPTPSELEDSPETAQALLHIRRLLSEETRTGIDAVAVAVRPVQEKRGELEEEGKRLQKQWRMSAARGKYREAEQITFEMSADDRKQLMKGLNDLVDRTDLYEPKVYDGLKSLDRAALTLMKRVDAGETLPPDQRQRLNRLLLEACFPNPLGKVYVAGWRPVMVIYGLSGLLAALYFWVIVRNRPEESVRCNRSERALIAAGRPAGAPGPHGRPGSVPWSRLLKSRSMWLSCFSQVGTNIGWVFLVTWFPRYLVEAHAVPILERGAMASTPLFVGWLGMFAGGPLTDWLVRVLGLRWGRMLAWSLSRFVAMGAFFACMLLDSAWGITLALSVVAFSTDLGTPSGWAYCQDVGGRYVGSVLGWGNMWGNLGATVSPILLAWTFDSFGWNTMFAVCGCAFFAAGVFALGIDATIPIAPADEDHDDDSIS